MSNAKKISAAATILIILISFQNCANSEPGSDPSPLGNSATDPIDTCPVGPMTEISKDYNLKGDCQISGNINLSGTAQITLTDGTLSLTGNVSMSGDSKITITNGVLRFSQTDYNQFSMTLTDRSHLTLKNSAFVTNATQKNNFSMVLEAKNNSIVDFENSILDSNTGSWLLGNFFDNSKLNMINTQNLPTEIYPFNAATISISSGSSFATVWVDFVPGSSGTVNIPTKNSQGNYDFNFTPSSGMAVTVNITASQGRLGLNSHPNSNLTVNGNGSSGTNDAGVVYGYYVENSSGVVSINGLNVGSDITRQFTDQGRNLQLNHVNLNPFSWQLYVNQSNGFAVSVTNSIINEVGVLTNGLLNISNCILQLAITGAFAPGAKLNISNSQIWSQAIQAHNGGEISISNSQLHGNYISAIGAGSKISLTNVGEAKNGVAPQSCAAVNGYPPNNNGSPLCNPFNTLYQCSQVATPTGGASFSASPNLACPI